MLVRNETWKQESHRTTGIPAFKVGREFADGVGSKLETISHSASIYPGDVMKHFLPIVLVGLCGADASAEDLHEPGAAVDVALAEEHGAVGDHAPGLHPEHEGAGLAEHVDDEHSDHEDHEHHWHGAFGTKAISAVAVEEGETLTLGGVGGLVEYAFFNHQLDIELAAAWLHRSDLTEIPVDVVFKHPFHINQTVDLFVGAGPMVVAATHHHPAEGEEHAHDEHSVYTGGIVSFGSYLWTRGHFGFVLEADYALVTADHKPAQEFEAGAGLMYRF